MPSRFSWALSDGDSDATVEIVGDFPESWVEASAHPTIDGHVECRVASGKPRVASKPHTAWHEAFADFNKKVAQRLAKGFVVRNTPSVENDFLRLARLGGDLWPSAALDRRQRRLAIANGLAPATDTVTSGGATTNRGVSCVTHDERRWCTSSPRCRPGGTRRP